MANEIQISATTGLLINCQLYSGLAAVGAPFTASEIPPMTGEYIASVPSNTPYGRYLVLALVGADVKIASGELLWGGDEEIDVEYSQILGLDPNNPSTTDVTTKKWTAGNITIDMGGDLTDKTIMSREP